MPVLFIATVLIPTVIAAVIVSFKSDVYTSESRFIVQSPDSKQPAGGLGALFKSGGFNSSSEEALAANSYILSRDALIALDRDNFVTRAYGNDQISIFDRFDPFGRGGGKERLFKFYEDKVKITYDGSGGITTLEVKAFDPASAREINRRLLDQAERLVNHMNERGREDVITYGNAELADAKRQSDAAAIALSQFRNREGVLDPEKQAEVQLQMISKLQDEMITTKTQLVQLQTLTPQNPQIPILATRIKELNREIGMQSGQITGNQKSLAGSAAQYQRLQLESQLADKVLASAISSVLDSKNEARRKRAYVERIVEPSFPDNRSGPKRIFAVLNVLVVGLILWGILSMILAGVREHTD